MSGIETAAALWGTAGTTAGVGGATATTAATTGLFGTAGSFAIMPTLSTFGTLLTAGGLIEAGIGKSEASKMNAKGAEYAALTASDQAQRDAEAIRRANESQASIVAEKQQRAKASRAVALGTSGIAETGSALKVEEGANYLDAMTLADIANNGELAVNNRLYKGTVEANRYRQQAALDSYLGNNALLTGYAGGLGTLLSRGAKYYG